MKNSQLQLRVSPEQKAYIRSAAAKEGMDMSAWVLHLIFPSPREKFLELIEKLHKKQETFERKYVLNELNIFLSKMSRNDIYIALNHYHQIPLNELMHNYVSAMIEQTCNILSLSPPDWLSDGLEKPFFSSDLVSLRLYLLSISPPAFRKRNIFIDATIGDII